MYLKYLGYQANVLMFHLKITLIGQIIAAEMRVKLAENYLVKGIVIL